MSRVFEVQATDGAARAGVLRTAHGEMSDARLHARRDEGDGEDAPPGRGARPRRADPARQHLPPALPARRRAGRATSAGCTASCRWDGPILTDSGGFQVFSLRDTIARVDDDGVTFRNVYDGAPTRFTPELAQRSRRTSAATSRCASTRCRRPASRGASSRRPCGARPTWAERQRDAPRADGQLRFGITQGGVDPELRRRSIEEIAALGFDGNAIGGLAIGEDRDVMFETTDWAAALLPAGQAALLHGHRRPRGDPRGDRGGRRHVRLRPADAHGPHRQRADRDRPAQPPERPLRPRRGAARGRLRLPGLRALHAAPTSATSSTRTSCSGCACSRSTIYASSLELTDGAREAIERGAFAAYKRDRLERLGNERTPDPHRDPRRCVAALPGPGAPAPRAARGDAGLRRGRRRDHHRGRPPRHRARRSTTTSVQGRDRARRRRRRSTGARSRRSRDARVEVEPEPEVERRRNAPNLERGPTRTPLTCASVSSRRSQSDPASC